MSKNRKNKTYAFDKDIENIGRYEYTNSSKYSAYVATRKQSEEIIKLLNENPLKNTSILDVGCGDGTFTFEIFKEVKPKKIVGFACAEKAIRVAINSIRKHDKGKIKFLCANVYRSHKFFKKNSFDTIIIRGVLHHLSKPEKAIKSLKNIASKIIVLEPNGYNPILKLIENTSTYHIKRGERSYWPPKINKWFANNGFKVKKQHFFSIIPYFCPENIVKLLKFIEPVMEKIPFIKMFYCGTNLIYYEKQ